MASDVFRVDTPSGIDDPRDGDDRIREVKLALRERLQLGGMYIDNETDDSPDADAGKIMCGIQVANRLTFYESDKPTPTEMLDFNDSTSLMKLGTGRGSGANSWIIEAETGNFEDVDIDGALDVAGSVTGMPAKSLYGVRQTTSVVTKTLTATYDALAETVVFTTATVAGDILVMWSGTLSVTAGDATTAVNLSVEFRRSTTQIYEAVSVASTEGVAASDVLRIPVTLFFLDTGAPNATLVTYDVRVKHTLGGTAPLQSQISARNRSLICTELIWN